MSDDGATIVVPDSPVPADDEEKNKSCKLLQIRKLCLDGKVSKLWTAIRDIETRTANDEQRAAMAPRLAELTRRHLTVRSRRERLDCGTESERVREAQRGLIAHRGPLQREDVIGLPESVLEACAVVNTVNASTEFRRKCMYAIINAHDLSTGEFSSRMTPQKNPCAKRARRLSRGPRLDVKS